MLTVAKIDAAAEYLAAVRARQEARIKHLRYLDSQRQARVRETARAALEAGWTRGELLGLIRELDTIRELTG